MIDITGLKEILILKMKYLDAAYFLPLLNKAENPLFNWETMLSELNFTNSWLPVDLISFGTLSTQKLPNIVDVKSPPSLIST